MTSQRAFWLTLATVGIPSVLIWGSLLHLIGFGRNEWPVYAFLILISTLLLSPFVYRSYMDRAAAKRLTRDDYLRRAIVSGALTVVYLVLGLMHAQYHQRSAKNWMMPALWFVATLYNLRRASQSEKTRYLAHE
jgi:hypothetical protein